MKLSFITDEVTQDFQTVLAFAERYGFDGNGEGLSEGFCRTGAYCK